MHIDDLRRCSALRGTEVRVGLSVEIERNAKLALVGDQLLFVLADR